MYLYINTCPKDYFEIVLFLQDTIHRKKIFFKGFQKSRLLLREIEKFLKKEKVSPSDIKGILSVKGPGNFSSVRTGVAIANTLAWSLCAPIAEAFDYEVPENEKEFWNFLKEKIKQGSKKKIVMPVYGKEPNITVKRIKN